MNEEAARNSLNKILEDYTLLKQETTSGFKYLHTTKYYITSYTFEKVQNNS